VGIDVRDRLITLQALRFVAATLVVADHALGPVIAWRLLPPWMTDFRWNLGGLGVAIFFVISGYIMMRTSGDRFGAPGAALWFAVRRFIRIAPIYWIATLIAFVHSDHSLFKLICSLGFVPYITAPGAAMRPLVGQGWTLDYEMLFYALFTVSLLLPKRTGLWAFFTAITAIVGAGLFLPSGLQSSFLGEIALFLSRPILLLFAVGMGIALLEAAGIVLPKIGRPLAVILALIIATMATVYLARTPDEKPLLTQLIFWIPAVLTVAVAVSSGERRPMSEEPLLSRLGDASYSV
jgi:peptidoglycan/LPS O-acetylase OafA/YrhL